MNNFKKEDKSLIIFCGLPGSGKSTIAEKISKKTGIKICCKDDIRKKVLGSVYNQEQGFLIKKILHKHILIELEKGNSVITDGTYLTPKDRKELLELFKGKYNSSYLIFVNTSLSECLKRNSLREKHVPEEVILKYSIRLTAPSEKEGFDYVEIINQEEKQYDKRKRNSKTF